METLAEFRARTGGFNRTSLPQNGGLRTSAGLSAKVDENGRFLPFAGNTVVFSLPSDFTEKAEQLRSRLYESCGEFLAEPIDRSTFHITLHDLVNGAPSPELSAEIQRTEPLAAELTERIKQENFHIKLKMTYLFNMVNTSLVLGFEPLDEESHVLLMEYYERFQAVVPLNYPLTPHMTVAYYKPGLISEEQLRRLQGVIDLAAESEETITLTGDMLSYMVFEDMNTYNL